MVEQRTHAARGGSVPKDILLAETERAHRLMNPLRRMPRAAPRRVEGGASGSWRMTIRGVDVGHVLVVAGDDL